MRKLAWKDTLVTSIVQETPAYDPDCTSEPFMFSEGENFVLTKWTLDEFKKVFSALWQGAELIYGDDAHNVTWLFLRNFDCPMSICDLVLNCINTNTDIQEAIALLGGGGAGTNGINPVLIPTSANANANLLQGCSLDEIWGQCVSIIEGLYIGLLDLIETMTGGTTGIELALRVIGAIPVIGTGVVSAYADLIDWLGDEFISTFEASWSDDIKYEAACLLFCFAKDDCVLSPNDVVRLLSQNASVDITTYTTVEDWLNAVTGNLFGDLLVYSALSFASWCLANGSSFAELVGVQTFSQLAALGIPDNAWSIYCEDCPEPPEFATPTVDFVSACGEGVNGTITDLTGGYWRIDAVNEGAAHRVYFRDIANRNFKIEDLVISRSILRFLGRDGDDVCYNQFTNWITEGVTVINEYGMIRSASPADFYITFKMTLV